MLYTPLLPEAASGTLEPRHVVVPLRQMCPHAELLLGRVTALDEERREPHTSRPRRPGRSTIAYEHLVARARRRRPHAPGARPRRARAGVQGPRRCDPPAQPRPARARGRRRRARFRRGGETHLSFVFVGAGYAGVEALAELSDLVADALRFYPRLRDAPQRWVLVDAAPKILPEIPPRLGEYAARELAGAASRSTSRRRSSRVAAARPFSRTAIRIPTHTLVWTAGVRANPLLGELGPAARRARPRPRRSAPPRRGARAGSGRSATARRCRTRRHPAASTRRPASTRSARRDGWRRTSPASREPYALPDARAGGDTRPLQRDRGRARRAPARLPGLVRDPELPPASSCRSSPARCASSVDWTTSLFFRRDIAELSVLGHPHRLTNERRAALRACGSGRRGSSCDFQTRRSSRRCTRWLRQGSTHPMRCRSRVAWTDDLTREGFLDYHRHSRDVVDRPVVEDRFRHLWLRACSSACRGSVRPGLRRRVRSATGSWLGARHQGRGIGTEMRAALIELAFGTSARTLSTSGVLRGEHRVTPRLREARLPHRRAGDD